MASRRPIPLPDLTTFDRVTFLTERWDFRPGEHVTILGPTGCGKTTLLQQLMQRSVSPRMNGRTLVTKPRDATVRAWQRQVGWGMAHDWPPPITRHKVIHGVEPLGWVVWPRHTFDPDKDDAHLATVFRKVLRDSYRRGNALIGMDEADSVGELRPGPRESPLITDHRTILKRGRSMGCSAMQAAQRPFGLVQEAYSQATHLFLFNDPDERSQDRYGEIGGVDPREVKAITAQLPEYHALYLRRRERRMCIVGP